MDGTLLNSEHNISKENIEAIKKAQEKGLHFVIATGRDYGGVEFLLKESGIECECVLMNGAEYRDKDGNVIEKINIDKTKATAIVNMIQEGGMSAEIFTDNGIYSTQSEADAMKGFAYRMQSFEKGMSFEEALEAVKTHRHFSGLKYIKDMDEFLNSSIEIRKIIAFYNDIDAIAKMKVKLETIEGLAVSSSFRDNIEVTDISAQKGIILGRVVDKYGISRDDVIVLGDSFNDYSMFKEFKNSYAMENAIPEIKEIASNITDTNDNAGVAKAIYSILED